MNTSPKKQNPPEAPGREFQRLLDDRGLSQGDFAEIIGYSEKQLSRILTGASPLTMDFAMRAERAIGENATEWLKKETEYRLALEKAKRERELEDVRIRQEIYERMPIREMVRLKWMEETGRDTGKLLSAVKAFWGLGEREALDFSFVDESLAMLMRSSDAYRGRFNPSHAATWLRQARLVAGRRTAAAPLPACDFEAVRTLASAIPAFSAREGGEEEFFSGLEALGVLAFHLPHLPKTYLDGAAFLQGETPVVVFTRRLDREDNFWFVMAHELAHVCLHLRPGAGAGNVFVECEAPASNRMEAEANALAGVFLGHEAIRRHFASCPRISRERILEYARSVPVHPGIVVGYLQHIRFLTYYNFNDLKVRASAPTAPNGPKAPRARRPRAERSRRSPV